MTDKDLLKETFSAGSCVSLDDLQQFLDGKRLPATEQHLSECPACRTELALLGDFHSGPSKENAAIAAAIAAQLRKNSPVQKASRFAWVWRPQVLAGLAAVILIVVPVGMYLRTESRTPLQAPDGKEIMRSASIGGLIPTGDIATPPASLRWDTVSGVREYRVNLMEVDRTLVWSGTSRVPSILIPEAIRAKMLPFKTLLWEVHAETANGTSPTSATQRIRVTHQRSNEQQ